jgi:hypothetical protein
MIALDAEVKTVKGKAAVVNLPASLRERFHSGYGP